MTWFMKFITTKSFMPFVIYRILLGIALFVLVGTDIPGDGPPRRGTHGGPRPSAAETRGIRYRMPPAGRFTTVWHSLGG